MVELCVITATIAQSNKLPLHKDKGRETVLFYCTDIAKHTGKTFEKASLLEYCFCLVALLCHHRHHCTIKQPSLAQRQRTETVLFYCNYITKRTNKAICRSKFSMYIDLFRHTITCIASYKKTAQHKFTVRFLFDLLQLKS